LGGNKWNYHGMVDKLTKKANGFGRAISEDGRVMWEGQFKDGELHGVARYIYLGLGGYGC